MKMTTAPEREMAAVSLRSACDMRRACRPGSESPMSPSSSARGTSAATESMTMTSTALERTRRLGDLERLLAGVGLRDQQLVGVDAELLGVDGIERVLGVDEGGDAAQALRLGDDVQREGGLAGRLRPVDLDDAAAREAADARARRRASSAPVGMTAISSSGPPAPSRMTAPLPNCRSIWEIARSSACRRSLFTSAMRALLCGGPVVFVD